LKKEEKERGLESPKKRWSRMKSQIKADKDPLVSLVFGSGHFAKFYDVIVKLHIYVVSFLMDMVYRLSEQYL
nr:hypothetical protein [Tanacetum cinerariifolium]